MNTNINARAKILTDGDTFLNRWSVLRTIESADIYLSATNYMWAKALLDKSVELLGNDREKMNEYCEAHLEVGYLFANMEVEKEYKNFIDSKKTLLGPILLTESGNLRLFIFKGIELSEEMRKNITPMMSETLAYAQQAYNSKEDIKFLTMNEETIDFCKKHRAQFEVGDLRV